MSWGSTVRPPRRATVSAIRRPATAVMLATTIGIVAPLPSEVVRSTSKRDADIGARRDHEDVVVGQFERRDGVEEAHEKGILPARGSSASGSSPRSAPCLEWRACWRSSTSTESSPMSGTACIISSRRSPGTAFFAEADARSAARRGRPAGGRLAREHEIVWLTGRPEWLRDGDRAVAGRRTSCPAPSCTCDPSRDYRPARLYKRDVLRRLAPRGIAAFVDDDEEVIARRASRRASPPSSPTGCPATATLRDAQERLGRT